MNLRVDIWRNRIKEVLYSILFKDSVWALIGSVLSNAFSLCAGITIARFLGKEVFGEYGMIKTTLVEIAILSTFGFGYATTKYIAQYKKEQPEKIVQIVNYSSFITLISSAFIAFLIFIFAEQLAHILKEPDLANMLRFSAVAIVFNAINTTQTGILSGFAAFKTIAFNKFISGFILLLLSVLLTYHYGLKGAIIALTVSLVLNGILNYISVHKILANYTKHPSDKKLNKQILQFSLPIALRDSSFTIVYWLTAFLIVHLSNYGELGIYTAAIQWGGIVSYLPGALNNVMLCYFSESVNEMARHEKIVKSMLLASIITTIIPFLFILFFSGFISSFYGSSFVGMDNILIIVMFIGVITAITGVYTQEFIALGRNWFLVITRFIRDSFSLIIAVALIKFLNLAMNTAFIFAISMATVCSIYCLMLHVKYKTIIH
jgi:O-antigen/teichoic acid export membrane protein